MGKDNNSPPNNAHNTMSGTLGQCIGKETKYMHASMQTYVYYTQNMGQDKNSPAENVHNTTSGTL